MRIGKILVILLVISINTFANANYIKVGSEYKWAGYADAKITLKVIDQDGEPVSGATVKGWLFNSRYKNVRREYKGLTDAKGMYVIEGRTSNDLDLRIEKDGYYFTRGEYDFRASAPAGKKAVVDGKWQPWNPTKTIVLKEKKNPIPMYAKSVSTTCPERGKPVGYDLLVGDWVAPYGKGEVSDFVFTVEGEYNAPANKWTRMTLGFSNSVDGVQEFKSDALKGQSELMSGYLAPTNGYMNIYDYRMIVLPDLEKRINVFPRKDMHFYFRIRTQTDDEGKIINAYYGKIYGDITASFRGFGEKKEIGVYFKYYLNPTPNDRNVEYKVRSNLFKGRDNYIGEP